MLRKFVDIQTPEGFEDGEQLAYFVAALVAMPNAQLNVASALCVRNCRAHLCVQGTDSSSVVPGATIVWSPTYHPECIWVATSGEVFFIQCDVPFQDATTENMANVIAGVKVTCAWCGSKREDGRTFKKCMGCKATRYCIQKCQIRHWNAAHHDECMVAGRGGGGEA